MCLKIFEAIVPCPGKHLIWKAGPNMVEIQEPATHGESTRHHNTLRLLTDRLDMVMIQGADRPKE